MTATGTTIRSAWNDIASGDRNAVRLSKTEREIHARRDSESLLLTSTAITLMGTGLPQTALRRRTACERPICTIPSVSSFSLPLSIYLSAASDRDPRNVWRETNIRPSVVQDQAIVPGKPVFRPIEQRPTLWIFKQLGTFVLREDVNTIPSKGDRRNTKTQRGRLYDCSNSCLFIFTSRVFLNSIISSLVDERLCPLI